MTRELAREQDKTRPTLAYALGLKTLLIFPCLLFVWLYCRLTRYDAVAYQAIWIFAAYGVVDSFTQMGYAVFRSRERMELETLVAALAKTLLTGLGIWVLLVGHGLAAFSIIFLLSAMVSMSLSFYLIRKKFVPLSIRFDRQVFKTMAAASANFGLALLVASSYDKIDILMLSWMKGMETVGLYSAPNKLLSFTNLVPTIFATAFFPQMARFASNRQELSRIFTLAIKYLLMLAIPLVAGVFMISDQLTVLLFGGLFADSAAALRIMAFASGVLFINLFLASLYGATNHQSKIVQIEIAALLFKIGINLALIPSYSYLGSAFSTVATECLVLLLALTWAVRHIAPVRELAFIPKFLFATAAMCGCLVWMKSWPLLALVSAAVLVYFLLLLLTRALDFHQLKVQWLQRS